MLKKSQKTYKFKKNKLKFIKIYIYIFDFLYYVKVCL